MLSKNTSLSEEHHPKGHPPHKQGLCFCKNQPAKKEVSQETLTKKNEFSSETLTRTLLTPTQTEYILDVEMRKIAIALAFILALLIYSQLAFQPINAQSEKITTSCTIFVDNIVEGQPVTATIQMSPATPTGEGYTELGAYLISPQGVGASSANGPWVYHIPTDTNNRATVTFNVPTYSGKWYVHVFFGGHYYANYSMLYIAGDWETGFTVYPAKTPTPSPTATPTASPISTANPSPTVPEFSWLTFLPILLYIPIVLIIIRKKSN